MANIRPIRPRIKIVALPAPVGGWNARDGYSAMPVDDAVTLTNYFPLTTSVALRYGYSKFATNMTGQVETIMAYAGGSTNKLLCANSGGRLYTITAGGAIGAADVSGLSNGRWQHINVATTGGNYLMMVNGADKAKFYTGTAWATDGDGSPYNITVADSSTWIGINLHKNRVWGVQQNTLVAWYLPTGAIGGAAAKLDLSAFAPHGGGLVAMATWTVDAGYGMDDLAVFITNRGDVIVYRGTDPSSASTWALVGAYWLGSPVGNRPFTKWKGDLLIICQDGVLPLSKALLSSRVDPRIALTNKIQSAISSAVTNYGSNFGWQVIPFPKQNMLVVNVPIAAGSAQEQYVMNDITGAWAQFQGWNANCFELYQDSLYFGANTYVGKAWDTNADNATAIPGFILQSFNDYGSPGQTKRVTSMRPMFLTNGVPQIYAGVNWDYNLANPTSALSFSPTAYGVWDTATWDSGLWGTDVVPTFAVQSVTGSGRAGAPVFKSSSSGLQIQLVSNALTVEIGGFL